MRQKDRHRKADENAGRRACVRAEIWMNEIKPDWQAIKTQELHSSLQAHVEYAEFSPIFCTNFEGKAVGIFSGLQFWNGAKCATQLEQAENMIKLAKIFKK